MTYVAFWVNTIIWTWSWEHPTFWLSTNTQGNILVQIGTSKPQHLRYVFWIPLCANNLNSRTYLFNPRLDRTRANANSQFLIKLIIRNFWGMFAQIILEVSSLFTVETLISCSALTKDSLLTSNKQHFSRWGLKRVPFT